MKDSPSKSCPKCKKRKARRRIGAGAGLIFKGTGFYETDYKKKAEPKKKESDKESSSGTDSSKASDKGSSKSESKDSTPAKKKEATAAKSD
jgi:predicted nucleic acid-binding Zn ribbon protein